MDELGMICTCDPEGVRETEARRLRLYERLGVRREEDLTETVLLSLAFDFQADADIGADMWFGVCVTSPLGDVCVECDDVADGFLAAWEHLADKYPERVTRGAGGSEGGLRVVRRISAGLLAIYEREEETYRAHRKAAHKDDNDCPPCEDCSVGRQLAVKTKIALEDAWGRKTLDPAVDKSFEYRTK